MKKTKEVLIVFIIIAMVIGFFAPLSVLAKLGPYTLTFNIQEGTEHEMINDGGHLKIDGQYVDLRDSNDSTIGTVTVEGNTATIVVEDGTGGTLNYSADGKFSLFVDGQEYKSESINTNKEFLVQDYEQGNGNGNPNGQGNGDEGDQNGERIYIVDLNQAEWNIKGSNITVTVVGKADINYREVELTENDAIKLEGFDSSKMEAVLSGADNWSAILIPNGDNEVSIARRENEGGVPNGVLVFHIREKQDDNQNEAGGEENIDFDIEFTNTHCNVWINNIPVMSDEHGVLQNQFVGTIESAGTTNPEETNVIRCIAVFGDAPVNEYIINGVTYKEGMEGVHASEEGLYIVVPGAEKYTIRGTGDENAAVPRTIIWANVDANRNAENFAEDMVLKHGKAKIIAIYDENGNKVQGEIDVDENGMGWAQVEPNSKVVFELVPEYGYQLTGVKANGFALEPQATINQYIFTMPDTNIHFAADFKKIDDIVKTESNKVTSGSVILANNSLIGGSAQLTVKDIELSPEKISNFEKAAGDYSIKTYLDIDLYQIFYKGKDDEEDVWSNKIAELDKEVTVSIKLADGVDGNNIVLVHNVHDGDEFEIIEIESYDEATNTITFKTKSFSNYAIATKTEVAKQQETDTKANVTNSENTEKSEKASNANNPTTGDDIVFFVIIFVIAIFGIIVLIRFKHKTPNKKIK